MEVSDLTTQLQDMLQQVQAYFGQLNEYETYAWIAEAAGFAMVLTGLILL